MIVIVRLYLVVCFFHGMSVFMRCTILLIAATKDPSNLLAHEAAFALGQMQDAEAVPALKLVLNDLSLHPIVRHEVGFCHTFSLCYFCNVIY